MSYMNQHMNTRINGVRGSVVVKSFIELFHGTTWENFQERHVSSQEYGQTKFNDLTIVAYYFKHHFNLRNAAIGIGYADVGRVGGTQITHRLKRINTASIIDVARALISNRLITIDDVKAIISAPVYPPANVRGTKPWNGIVYRWYAKHIVMGSIHKCGSEALAARKFNCHISVIQYWAALDVVDPMIRHTQKGGE